MNPNTLATIARVSVKIFKLARKFYELLKVASLAWWYYVIGILSVFFGAMLLNYIVKRINEARLETRFSNLRKKAPNQSTQIQRPLENNHRPILSENIANNLNKGISLIFNKKENLIEGEKRKEDQPRNSGVSDCVINIDSPENNTARSSTHSAKDDDVNKSVFLGTIYKELYEKRVAIDKTKSLSNADRDSILNEIVDKMVWKMNESKSTPSIKKLIDMQNEDELKDWAFDLVKKEIEPAITTIDLGRNNAPAKASTSECC